ncbi:hypothetical protein BN2476_2040014 [Paraburkholderia piptadeniae]|uniref:Uncharacterized protein n=1 Tax=Paraburkholderia piptadeniae TaxID=1701573 RepID=A0A1N7SXD0_9BURK|nr:hypothetical protein BN2476_2040014 [Paraburkholderia piptadeniae]
MSPIQAKASAKEIPVCTHRETCNLALAATGWPMAVLYAVVHTCDCSEEDFLHLS